jgi:tetratricopeptide (TPR) repeat protein
MKRHYLGSMAQKELLVCVGLCLLVLVCYWPVREYGFVNIDDLPYITQYNLVQSGLTMEGVVWAFRTVEPGYWRPLAWLSHMLDCQLFGANAGGHHWTNVLLHLINTLLLFAVLRNLTGALWRSACVAALFAAHPMNVESVAWIANRPGLLSACFGFTALLCYTWYLQKPSWRGYLAVAAAFSLSLMAKPMLLTLPFLLLLIDFWPGGRWGRVATPVGLVSVSGSARTLRPLVSFPRLLLEKTPLLLISAATAVMTLVSAGKFGIPKLLDQFPLDVRIANSLQTYVLYIKKLLWPMELVVFYPHPGHNALDQAAAAGLVIAAVSLIAVAKKGRFPYLLTGWFWFLGSLVPVSGLVQFGRQALADRYIYFPGIGLFILMVWGTIDLCRVLAGTKWIASARGNRLPGILETAGRSDPDSPSGNRSSGVMRPLLICIVVLIILLAGFSTRKQLAYWQSSRTLFAHAVSVTTQNDFAHSNLAHALFREGHFEEAADHYEEAIRIRPKQASHFSNYGVVLERQGKMQEAMEQYRKAVSLDPKHFRALFNLGRSLEILGRYAEADAFYRAVLLEKPDHFYAHRQRGLIALYHERYGEAIGHLQTALRIQPGDRATQEGLSLTQAWEEHREKVLDRGNH